MAVDDLQWLDRASANVVAFAARRLESEPVGVLATVRVGPDEREPTEIGEALREGLTRMPLGPMSVSAIYELTHARLGYSLTRPLLLRVHETSEGRPFLALELARELRDAKREIDSDEPLPVPHELRELVLSRLARLSRATRETLLAAAALARPTLDLLERAEPEKAMNGLRAGTDAAVVELDGDRIRFTHPLLRSFHYANASPARRRAVHGKLADVVSDPEERARHLALATEGPDESVAAALEAAAAGAVGRGAVPAAADLAARAVALTMPRDRDRLHRRRLASARLAFSAGDRAGAERMLDDALCSARTSRERAETLLERGLVLGSEDLRAGLALFREAAAEPLSDEHLRASILRRLALREGYSGEGYDRASQIAQDAVELAEQTADGQLLAQALSTLGYVEFFRGQERPHDVLRRAEALEVEAGITSMDGAVETYAEVLTDCGEHAAARERFDRVIAFGRATEDAGVCRPLFRLAFLEWLAGDWDRARELGLEAHEVATQSGRDAQAPLGMVVVALVDAMRGDVRSGTDRTLEALAATDRAGRHSGWPRSALALIQLSLQRYEHAYSLLEPYFTRIEGLSATFPETHQSDAVEALAESGRLDEARALLAPLEDAAGRLDVPWAVAAAARCRGLLDAATGKLDPAEVWLERAVAVGETAGLPLEHGRSLLALGTIRRRAQKKAAAREALNEALDVFEQLGARLWADRARRELRRIGGRATPRSELSETEARIVELVVVGRSNKEVASALHLSPKTVEWNLSKIYRKLGIHSRTELAATRSTET